MSDEDNPSGREIFVGVIVWIWSFLTLVPSATILIATHYEGRISDPSPPPHEGAAKSFLVVVPFISLIWSVSLFDPNERSFISGSALVSGIAIGLVLPYFFHSVHAGDAIYGFMLFTLNLVLFLYPGFPPIFFLLTPLIIPFYYVAGAVMMIDEERSRRFLSLLNLFKLPEELCGILLRAAKIRRRIGCPYHHLESPQRLDEPAGHNGLSEEHGDPINEHGDLTQQHEDPTDERVGSIDGDSSLSGYHTDSEPLLQHNDIAQADDEPCMKPSNPGSGCSLKTDLICCMKQLLQRIDCILTGYTEGSSSTSILPLYANFHGRSEESSIQPPDSGDPVEAQTGTSSDAAGPEQTLQQNDVEVQKNQFGPSVV